MVDCLLIGHSSLNNIDEELVRFRIKHETNKVEYRKLLMGIVKYQNRKYSISGLFNKLYYDENKVTDDLGPISKNNIFPSAIAYLSFYLHKKGFLTDYISAFLLQKDELAMKLKQNDISCVAISTTFCLHFDPIIEIVDFIKKYNSDVKIIVGGPFILNLFGTVPVEEVTDIIKNSNVDFFINSPEGEAELCEVITAVQNHLDYSQINNIAYKDGDNYVFTNKQLEYNGFDNDITDWSMFKDNLKEEVSIRTAKSCPFSCSFCQFPSYSGPYRTADIHTVERVLNGIKQTSDIKNISFVDDTFNVPPARFKEILRMMIKNKYDFKWNSFLRCQFVDEETAQLMKESGCEGVLLGIESGSQKMLNYMNKAVKIEDYRKGLSLLNKYNITSTASMIVGFPGETAETIQETYEFLEESKPTFYRTFLWVNVPMTPIYSDKRFHVEGSGWEWKHDTMDSLTAEKYIYQLFLNVKGSIMINDSEYYDYIIYHLLHRRLKIEQVKSFINCFNNPLKDRLTNNNDNYSLSDSDIYELRKILKEISYGC